ncbi:MAG: hypothetical protein R6X29_12745 [Acidimicrobiia bacterium]
MTLLVTGAGGVLGRRVVARLAEQGHRVVEAAEPGVTAIVDCAGDPEATERLLAGCERSVHIVYASKVGCDVIPRRDHEAALAGEQAVERSGLGWTILRATEFHQQVWEMVVAKSRRPLVVVPADTRFQVLDPGVVAERLVAAVGAGPQGRLPEVGGSFAYEARDLARSVLAAIGSRRRVVAVNYPGIVGAALRAGANTTPNRATEGESWNDFVRRRIKVFPIE